MPDSPCSPAAQFTLILFASDNGLDMTSFPNIWATKSITGSASMKAVDDISGIDINHHVSSKQASTGHGQETTCTIFASREAASHLTDVERQAHLCRPDALVEPTPRLQAVAEP